MAACNLLAKVSVTGDCSNSGLGELNVNIIGSNPPFYYQMVSPTVDPAPIPVGVTSFTETNLTPNTYTYLIFDSCPGTPTSIYINAVISDGVCASIIGHSDTTCNQPNGVITATTNNELIDTQYFLYENSLGYITSAASINDIYVFNNLDVGTYYVTVYDGGGCTAKSETCIIKQSTPLDFGFYIVNDTGCEPTPAGKIFVTGVTGYGPYIYQWSTGALTTSITGLTQGTYQLTVTDSTGCQVTKLATVQIAPQIQVVNYIPVSPSCSGNNGQITIVISGGTAPYNYVASNGQNLVTFENTFTLTGLSSGNYTINVTDAGLCTKSFPYTLTAPNGFSIISVGIVNSTCNNSSGALSPINLAGGTPPFTYTLQYPSGGSLQQTINGFSNQFLGLSAGTYTLTISNVACSITNTYTINNTIKFGVSTAITGTTCDTNNGSVKITLTTGGTSPYTYYFQGQPTVASTSQTAITFNNLYSGTYLISVSDATNCTQTQTIVVPDTPSIDFVLDGTDATNINNGQIQVYITSGPPPYNISWSQNVNGQTGLTLTNLSAGTYSVLITDGNGCQLSRSVTLYGYNTYGTYGLFNYCESTIQYNGVVIQKKIPQMYVEGFYDLVSGETNCVLNSAIFYCQVSLGGVTNETPFYNSNSLGDYPTDNEWFDAIRESLLSYPVVGKVIINPSDNRITIQTNCSDQSLSLDNTEISVSMKIGYDISCVCTIPPIPPQPVVIKDCDMIYIQPPNEIFAYEFSSDTSSILTVDDYNYDSLGIAFTATKLWLYDVAVSSSTIQEYNITLNGFTATLNRTLNLGFEMGQAIGVKNNTTLVTTDTSTQSSYNFYSNSVYPNYFVELNINTNTPVITNKAVLPIDRYTVGAIVFSQDYTQMISLQVDNSSAPIVSYYIAVHETTNYNMLISSELNYIPGEPSGLFVDNGTVYLVDDTSSVYEVDYTFPYTVTPTSVISAAGAVESIYQQTNCFTEKFTICEIGCGDSVELTILNATFIGIFETYINVGSGIGTVEVTFTYQASDLKIPIRYQLEWNNTIVADSLIVYGQYDPSIVTAVTGSTFQNNYANKYLYCSGNGNAVNALDPSDDWLINGQKPGKSIATVGQITDSSINRGTGFPGQIGVVNNYPTPGTPCSDPNVKLQFTKTLANSNIVKVIISSKTKTGFTFEVTQCP